MSYSSPECDNKSWVNTVKEQYSLVDEIINSFFNFTDERMKKKFKCELLNGPQEATHDFTEFIHEKDNNTQRTRWKEQLVFNYLLIGLSSGLGEGKYRQSPDTAKKLKKDIEELGNLLFYVDSNDIRLERLEKPFYKKTELSINKIAQLWYKLVYMKEKMGSDGSSSHDRSCANYSWKTFNNLVGKLNQTGHGDVNAGQISKNKILKKILSDQGLEDSDDKCIIIVQDTIAAEWPSFVKTVDNINCITASDTAVSINDPGKGHALDTNKNHPIERPNEFIACEYCNKGTRTYVTTTEFPGIKTTLISKPNNNGNIMDTIKSTKHYFNGNPEVIATIEIYNRSKNSNNGEVINIGEWKMPGWYSPTSRNRHEITSTDNINSKSEIKKILNNEYYGLVDNNKILKKFEWKKNYNDDAFIDDLNFTKAAILLTPFIFKMMGDGAQAAYTVDMLRAPNSNLSNIQLGQGGFDDSLRLVLSEKNRPKLNPTKHHQLTDFQDNCDKIYDNNLLSNKNQLRRDPHIKVKWPPYSKILKDTHSLYKNNNLMSIYNTFDIISTIQALKKGANCILSTSKKDSNTYHLAWQVRGKNNNDSTTTKPQVEEYNMTRQQYINKLITEANPRVWLAHRELFAKGYDVSEADIIIHDYIRRTVNQNSNIKIPNINFELWLFKKLNSYISNMKSKMDENSTKYNANMNIGGNKRKLDDEDSVDMETNEVVLGNKRIRNDDDEYDEYDEDDMEIDEAKKENYEDVPLIFFISNINNGNDVFDVKYDMYCLEAGQGDNYIKYSNLEPYNIIDEIIKNFSKGDSFIANNIEEVMTQLSKAKNEIDMENAMIEKRNIFNNSFNNIMPTVQGNPFAQTQQLVTPISTGGKKHTRNKKKTRKKNHKRKKTRKKQLKKERKTKKY